MKPLTFDTSAIDTSRVFLSIALSMSFRIDRPVAVLDDAELDAFLLELLVHVERGREVQLVDDDVAAFCFAQVQAHHDDVLAVGGVGGVGDLVGASR